MLLNNTALEDKANNHYSVYVIELSKAVLKEPKFVKANPNYDHNKLCLYVGATGLDVSERFAKHKAGVKSNKYVQLYGIRLLPGLSKGYNNLTYEEAWAKEPILAAELRKKGYAVFQA